MGKLGNLEEVSATVLPAKVLVLLSKYAQTMRKHTGLVIKISSMNVFKHVHNTHKLTQHPEVIALHNALLAEVNRHLNAGTMHTVGQRLAASQQAHKSVHQSQKITIDEQSLHIQSENKRNSEQSTAMHLDKDR